MTRPLFRIVLGERSFMDLPAEVRALHDFAEARSFEGRGRIDRAPGWLAAAICTLFGFPPTAEDVPVRVEMRRTGEVETWLRCFGRHRFRSRIRGARAPGEKRIIESFGPFAFEIALEASSAGLAYPLATGRVFGLPLPRAVLPVSETREYADGGRAHFDVAISLPLIGPLVRYRGWLIPKE